MAKHTPGPWTTNELGRIYAANNICVALCEKTPPQGDGLKRSERDANARLIAAAPDMLAALKECITLEGAHSMASGGAGLLKVRLKAINAIATAAIAKAESR